MDLGVFPVSREFLTGDIFYWELEPLRFIGELYFVNNDVLGEAGSERAAFTNYNLQAEHTLHPNWIVYARTENTLNAGHDPYLDLFPEFIKRRALAGLRYDLAHNQAIKLEWAKVKRHPGQFDEVILQWSAAFP